MTAMQQAQFMRRLVELNAQHFAEGRLPNGGRMMLQRRESDVGDHIFTLTVEHTDAAPLPEDLAALGRAAGAPDGVEWMWHRAAGKHKAWCRWHERCIEQAA